MYDKYQMNQMETIEGYGWINPFRYFKTLNKIFNLLRVWPINPIDHEVDSLDPSVQVLTH